MEKKVYRIAIKGNSGIYVSPECFSSMQKAKRAVLNMIHRYDDDLHDIDKINGSYYITLKDNPDDYIIFQIVTAPFYKVIPFVIITNNTFSPVAYAKTFEMAREKVSELLKLNYEEIIGDYCNFIVAQSTLYESIKTHYGIIKCTQIKD